MRLSPKMAAFMDTLYRSGIPLTAGHIAGRAGYAHSLTRNGASAHRTMYALQRHGLVAFDGHDRWRLTDRGKDWASLHG